MVSLATVAVHVFCFTLPSIWSYLGPGYAMPCFCLFSCYMCTVVFSAALSMLIYHTIIRSIMHCTCTLCLALVNGWTWLSTVAFARTLRTDLQRMPHNPEVYGTGPVGRTFNS